MDNKVNDITRWFREARYGLFIHYGLYSLLERGEWVMNKEGIPKDEYALLQKRFTAESFDADDIIRRARDWGMKYAVLTTKHHEGFCLYDSRLTGFTSPGSPTGRDLVAEFVQACRKYGLRVGLYHTLNDWSAAPDAVNALERPEECYQPFIDYVHGQIREIMSNYGKIDIMWYDGWWPYDGDGWQAVKLNAMVRELQPDILINGRCGIKGDFVTPEGHITAFKEPWEACATLNEHWGYHRGDDNWKSPRDVVEMLRKCSAGHGNLLLNVGLKGDGSLPEGAIECLDTVGEWLKINEEAIIGTERFDFSLRDGSKGYSDWAHSGQFTASGSAFYWHIRCWPGSTLCLNGIRCTVTAVTDMSTGRKHPFIQEGEQIRVEGFPEERDTAMPVVIRFKTLGKPRIYLCGGCRVPEVSHCRYDPLPSEILT